MKLRDLLIVAGVVVLAGLAAADAVLRDAPEPPSAAPATGPDEAEDEPQARERFLRTRAPGSVVFLDGDGCRIRQVVASSGDELPLPELETACELWAPDRGTRIAYRVGPSVGEAVPFRFVDLTHSREELGGARALFGAIAWSPDGRRAAWCQSTRLGFDHDVGDDDPPETTRGCPRGYTGDGEPLFVAGRRLVAAGKPLLTATGSIRSVHRGNDGSYAVVTRDRIERYAGGRLTHARLVRPGLTAARLVLAPDNCAVLAARAGVVALVDLGCFRGSEAIGTLSPDNCVDRAAAVKSECVHYPAPRAFEGDAAAWSPDGAWVAVAEPEALTFHRVVGGYAVVRWPAEPRAVAWLD